jgi:enamine deaminase RidA (YjgF/YER057c/UK114 family)
MHRRTTVSADRPWEEVVGYSRAVRVGDIIEVSGTAGANPDGTVVAPGDVYGQAREALRIIGKALEDLGAGFEDVTRTRIFLKDPSRWQEAGRAHGEIFSSVRPATILAGVTGFVDPDILVEIEASAVVQH